MEALHDAVAYFSKVQQLAVSLIAENKRLGARAAPAPPPLAAAMASMGGSNPSLAVGAPATPAPAPASTGTYMRDGSRLFLITSFLLLSNVWLPVMLSYGSAATSRYTGRLLQADEPAPAAPLPARWLPLLLSFVARAAIFMGALLVVFVCTLLQEYVLFVPSEEAVRQAAQLHRTSLLAAHRGQAGRATRYMLRSLALLGKPFPSTTLALAGFILLQ